MHGSYFDNSLKRLFDVVAASAGIFVLSPALAAAALWVKLDSRGPIFYRQERIGKNGVPFRIWKFRTMVTDADRKGTLVTVGDRDPRITRAGYWLRKTKLDELPQLLNVLAGQMSFVGPRPEVKKYVDLYTSEQRAILAVRPGITDQASIAYRRESEILATKTNPEEYYRRVVMGRKIALNLRYLKQRTIVTDIALIFRTIFRISR